MALRSLRFNNVENGKEEWYPRVMLGAELLGPGPCFWWVRGFQPSIGARMLCSACPVGLLELGIDGERREGRWCER